MALISNPDISDILCLRIRGKILVSNILIKTRGGFSSHSVSNSSILLLLYIRVPSIFLFVATSLGT